MKGFVTGWVMRQLANQPLLSGSLAQWLVYTVVYRTIRVRFPSGPPCASQATGNVWFDSRDLKNTCSRHLLTDANVSNHEKQLRTVCGSSHIYRPTLKVGFSTKYFDVAQWLSSPLLRERLKVRVLPSEPNIHR